MGHDLHRPQPPEAVHPRKGRLSRPTCNKCPSQRLSGQAPSFLNSGAEGTYASITAKLTAPGTLFGTSGIGAYLSGEFGRQWLGTTDSFYSLAIALGPNGINYADYNTWNVGVGFTYKVFTLDLRYSGTDLSKANCNAFTGDFTAQQTGSFSPINPGGFGSKWCGDQFIAKLSADVTLGALK